MVSNGRNKRLTSIILAITVLSALALFTVAQNEPIGPDSITNVSSERRATTSPQTSTAQAGNVSELSITATGVTKAWQGFYGNITGTITLEDSNGATFYDWSSAEPEGEIYASVNQSITWSSIGCFGFNDATGPNLTNQESLYGMDSNDVDGIDETYNETTHDTFFVGTTSVSGCQTAYVHDNNGAQSSDWQNVLLDDDNALVFTTLIENRSGGGDKLGFNGIAYDFQMLVAEDGHDAAGDSTTTYYFWVEIE